MRFTPALLAGIAGALILAPSAATASDEEADVGNVRVAIRHPLSSVVEEAQHRDERAEEPEPSDHEVGLTARARDRDGGDDEKECRRGGDAWNHSANAAPRSSSAKRAVGPK